MKKKRPLEGPVQPLVGRHANGESESSVGRADRALAARSAEPEHFHIYHFPELDFRFLIEPVEAARRANDNVVRVAANEGGLRDRGLSVT